MNTLLLVGEIVLVQFLRYGFIAGGAYFIINKWAYSFFKKFRIQESDFAQEQIFHEIKNSMVSALIFGFIFSIIVHPAFIPFTKIYFNSEGTSTWMMLLSLFALVIINDTYFYWMHRALHHPSLFRFAHHTHHVSTNPSPLASYSFHPIETVLEAIWIFPVLFVLPVHINVLIGYSILSFLNNVRGHLSVELISPNLRGYFPFNIVNTPTHHSHHHKYFNSNYGLYFLFWDRMCGTERKLSRTRP
jgi:Delta7-sterol 5-desaturase